MGKVIERPVVRHGLETVDLWVDPKPGGCRSMALRDRAFELAKHITVLPGRLCVIQYMESNDVIRIPRDISVRYENSQMAAGSWYRGVVVASGLPELVVGAIVCTNYDDGLIFDGGQVDPDSPTISGLLKPDETLKFFKPRRDWKKFRFGKPTMGQGDIGLYVMGVAE